MLGRATWTVMHTTAAYLPETPLTDVEISSIQTLFKSMPIHYPGRGQILMKKIFADDTIQKELNAIKTKEDAQLFVWKGEDLPTLREAPSLHPRRPYTSSSLHGLLRVSIGWSTGVDSQHRILDPHPTPLTPHPHPLLPWPSAHNALTAIVHPSRTPFPESLGLHVGQFRIANPEKGDVQFDTFGASDVQKKVLPHTPLPPFSLLLTYRCA